MTSEIKPHPLAHILRAIADGVPVEFRHSDQHPWITYEPGEHYVVIDSTPDKEVWRIKPKPKVKKWRWVFDGPWRLGVTTNYYKDQEDFEKAGFTALLVQKIDSTEIEVEE